MRKFLIALPLVAAALVTSANATTFDTSSFWSGANYAVGFGNGTFSSVAGPSIATSTYGQTFIAPSDSVLKTYTSKFEFNEGVSFTYRLIIAAWSDATLDAAAVPVFQSDPITSLAASTTPTFQSVAVNVNVTLVTGSKYVAFYTTTREGAQPQGSMKMAITDSPAYADGTFVYSGSDYGTLFTDGWTADYTPNDTVFKAEFDAVPEPAPMFGLGLGLFALLRRRRNR